MNNFTFLLAQIKKNRGYTKYGGGLCKSELEEIWGAQKGICPITGVALIIPTRKNYAKTSSLYRASIDRKDNNLGYTKGNIRIVSLMYNFARNTNSEESVIEFCKLVVENQKNDK